MKLDEEVPETFDIWEINYPILQVFCACSDDWNKDSLGQYQSINKSALGAVMEMMEVNDRKSMFTDIMFMQRAALEVLANG